MFVNDKFELYEMFELSEMLALFELSRPFELSEMFKVIGLCKMLEAVWVVWRVWTVWNGWTVWIAWTVRTKQQIHNQHIWLVKNVIVLPGFGSSWFQPPMLRCHQWPLEWHCVAGVTNVTSVLPVLLVSPMSQMLPMSPVLPMSQVMPVAPVRRTETVTVTVVVGVRLSLCWQGGGNAQPGDILPKGGWWWGGMCGCLGFCKLCCVGFCKLCCMDFCKLPIFLKYCSCFCFVVTVDSDATRAETNRAMRVVNNWHLVTVAPVWGEALRVAQSDFTTCVCAYCVALTLSGPRRIIIFLSMSIRVKFWSLYWFPFDLTCAAIWW